MVSGAARSSYLSPKTIVKRSRIHGKGLFAAQAIRKGEVVAIKGGRIFDRATLQRNAAWLKAAEIQIGDNLFIGPANRRERSAGMIFSNHSCAPNIGVQGQIVFVALRNIKTGEELTHDWAMTDDDIYTLECCCGAANCRRIITGQDWRREDLQKKYGAYMAWHLREKIARAKRTPGETSKP